MKIVSQYKCVGVCVFVYFSTLLIGCSIAPITPIVNASTLEKGTFGYSAWAVPLTSATAAYGVSDKFNVGAGVEQWSKINLWSKYSLINQNSLAVAGTAGVFIGPSVNKAKGYFVGAILNHKLNETFGLFANYRYTRSIYRELDRSATGLTDSQLYYGIDSRDSIDLSKTSQLNLGLSFYLNSPVRFNLGYGCQHHHENDDPDINTKPCSPLIGLSIN